MKTTRIKFKNRSGQQLVGILDQPGKGDPKAYALFAHCFTCSKNLKAVYHISEAMAERQIATFRFDFTGLGESEGDFSETNLSTNIEDLIDASEHLAENYSAPKILIGHSLGGSAIVQAAEKISSAKALVLIATPYEPKSLKQSLKQASDQIERKGEAEVTIGGKSFRVKEQLFDDLEKRSMQQRVDALNLPLLIFHAPEDHVVDIEDAMKLFNAANYPKNFISLDQSDHLLSDKNDSEYVGHVIAEWVGRYVW